MIQFIQFIRNFNKQQTVGVLNICGLSLGVMVSVIVGLWSINELSFDKFHKNRDRIYRIITNIEQDDMKTGCTVSPFGLYAKEELPAVEDMCRIYYQTGDIRVDEELLPTVRTIAVDKNFFTFFSFTLIEGDINEVLSAPGKVVISEWAANRLFPQENPMGKMLKFYDTDHEISGIMKDIPINSTIQSNFIFPFFGWWAELGWDANDSFTTFLLLQDGVNAEDLAEPLTQLIYRNDETFQEMGITITLQAMSDIYFGTEITYDWITVKGNKMLVTIFIITALAILIIACINFVNLFISTSFIRAKSIGVKKAFGAKKINLISEFYIETACYVFISVLAGLMIVHYVFPIFNNFTQSELKLDFSSPILYLFLISLILIIVLLAGSFPALYMTKFSVIETLFSKFRGKNVSFLQKCLVVIQFTASITLLIAVVFVQKQVNHIISFDLGFNKENILYIQGRDNFENDFKTLEDELLKEPSIVAVTRKVGSITDWKDGCGIKRVPEDNNTTFLMELCRVNPNYFEFFEMEIIDGENPFYLESTQTTDVVINEAAAKLLGYEKPVGRSIIMVYNDGKKCTIKGVVKNAYTKSLHREVDPQIYINIGGWQAWNIVFFKTSGDPQRAINFIEQKWKEREGDNPFFYWFLDETYQNMYASEMNARNVFSFAMLISLIITVSGLFAMAYYATQRRIREVALRKIHGAKIFDLYALLNKNFLFWVAISFIIACPIAYYSLQKWLESFAVRTSLNAWVFLLVGALALLITLLTTGYQTWKVATAKPVDVLIVNN